jgi:hypothetical protein
MPLEGPAASGGPWPFAPSRRCVRRPGSQGLLLVFRIPGYPGPPAPGPLQWPSFGPGVERRPKPAAKTLMRRRLMRRTMTKTVKDQKTSSRASAGEGRDHVHISSAHLRAEQEDKGRRPRTTNATPDREETNFSHACIKRHSGCWPPPLKIA